MSKVLITGGAGFIGSHLCKTLSNLNYDVTCLDNLRTGSLVNISDAPRIRFIEGDVNDADTLRPLLGESFDIVFHYAATVGVRNTVENPFSVLNDVRGLLNIADFVKAGGAEKIVYASSSEIYGNDKKIPSKESDGHSGWSPYSTVKIYGEHLYRELWLKYKIPTISLRFFNVYGNNQIKNDYGFVVSRFIHQVLQGKHPTVFGDGKQTRDFVHVSDNIKLTLQIMKNPAAYGEIINLGSGKETSVVELAQMIINLENKTNLLQPVFLPAREMEIKRRCASTQKMKQITGASCSKNITKGIMLTLNSAKRQLLKKEQYVPRPSMQQL